MIIKNIVANIYSYSIKIKNKFSDFKLPEMKQKLKILAHSSSGEAK
mgnify:CR=1 FL=1